MDPQTWVPIPLEGERFAFGSARGGEGSDPFLRPAAGQNLPEDTWVLLAAPSTSASINGQATLLGIRALKDRDEIVVGGERLFFTKERLAMAQPFPGAGQAVFCARCKQEIASPCPAVRCPACGTWCHESEDLPCWTYAVACPLCDQPTALDAGYRWTPEEL